MDITKSIHEELIFKKRVEVLSQHLSTVLPKNARILDVGCGDGMIDLLIKDQHKEIHIEGIDVFDRPKPHIPVTIFNGTEIPFDDNSFDIVMFVDVLHHTVDPKILLLEAKRVASKAIVTKDHTRDGFCAGLLLRIMDWAGNAPHGVKLTYNYWSKQQWDEVFRELGLKVENQKTSLNLYHPTISWVFDRSLHFIVKLSVQN